MRITANNHTSLLLTTLAIFVVGLGAYTRLSDSGLGCPDWPGCFGQWIVDKQATIPALSPSDSYKAWTEMIHRYIAGILGVIVLSRTAYQYQQPQNQMSIRLSILYTILAIMIIIQALFGMWTVTWKLHPLAVMPHLIGGMSLSTLIFKAHLYQSPPSQQTIPTCVANWLWCAISCVCLQIVLGGWTSANYAQLICPDFPTCQGSWFPNMNFLEGFSPQPIGPNYEGGLLSGPARTAIHFSHRLGGLITLIVFAILSKHLHSIRHRLNTNYIRQIQHVGLLLATQITLGVANIVLALPLSIAVAHNVCALLLLLALIHLEHQSTTKPASYHA